MSINSFVSTPVYLSPQSFPLTENISDRTDRLLIDVFELIIGNKIVIEKFNFRQFFQSVDCDEIKIITEFLKRNKKSYQPEEIIKKVLEFLKNTVSLELIYNFPNNISIQTPSPGEAVLFQVLLKLFELNDEAVLRVYVKALIHTYQRLGLQAPKLELHLSYPQNYSCYEKHSKPSSERFENQLLGCIKNTALTGFFAKFNTEINHKTKINDDIQVEINFSLPSLVIFYNLKLLDLFTPCEIRQARESLFVFKLNSPHSRPAEQMLTASISEPCQMAAAADVKNTVISSSETCLIRYMDRMEKDYTAAITAQLNSNEIDVATIEKIERAAFKFHNVFENRKVVMANLIYNLFLAIESGIDTNEFFYINPSITDYYRPECNYLNRWICVKKDSGLDIVHLPHEGVYFQKGSFQKSTASHLLLLIVILAYMNECCITSAETPSQVLSKFWLFLESLFQALKNEQFYLQVTIKNNQDAGINQYSLSEIVSKFSPRFVQETDLLSRIPKSDPLDETSLTTIEPAFEDPICPSEVQKKRRSEDEEADSLTQTSKKLKQFHLQEATVEEAESIEIMETSSGSDSLLPGKIEFSPIDTINETAVQQDVSLKKLPECIEHITPQPMPSLEKSLEMRQYESELMDWSFSVGETPSHAHVNECKEKNIQSIPRVSQKKSEMIGKENFKESELALIPMPKAASYEMAARAGSLLIEQEGDPSARANIHRILAILENPHAEKLKLRQMIRDGSINHDSPELAKELQNMLCSLYNKPLCPSSQRLIRIFEFSNGRYTEIENVYNEKLKNPRTVRLYRRSSPQHPGDYHFDLLVKRAPR
jgi:hypothetical protein